MRGIVIPALEIKALAIVELRVLSGGDHACLGRGVFQLVHGLAVCGAALWVAGVIAFDRAVP